MGSRIQIFVVDSIASRRASLCRTLYSQGFGAIPCEAMDEVTMFSPSASKLLVYDEEGAIDQALKFLDESQSWMPIFAYCDHIDVDRVVSAMRKQVSNYIEWPIAADALTQKLLLNDGEAGPKPELAVRSAEMRSKIALLTNREREILQAVAEGGTSRTIAERFSLSPRTVDTHRTNLMKKVGAKTIAELVGIVAVAELRTA